MSEAGAYLDTASEVAVPQPGALRQAPMRMVRWLRTRSFAFAPEQLGLAEGARAAVVVSAMVLATYLSGEARLTWAAFAAFWTCLADPGGGNAVRLRSMGGFVLLAAPTAFLFSYLASFGPAATALAIFLIVSLFSLSAMLGPEMAQPGLLASVVAVVAAEQPQSFEDSLMVAIIVLCGGLSSLIFCLAVWRIHPHRLARSAVAAAYRDLYELALERRSGTTTSAASAQTEADHRRAVRAAIEQARATVDRIAAQLGPSAAGDALATAIQAGDQIFAGLIALSVEERGQRLDAAMASLQVGLLEARRQILRSDPQWTRLRSPAEPGLPTRAIDLFSRALFDLCQLSAATPSSRFVPRRTRPTLSRAARAAIVRHGLRLAVVVTAAYLVAKLFDLPYAYWATMAAIVVMRPQADAAWPRMLERILGSVAGGFAAAFLAARVGSSWELLLLVAPLAAATIALRSVNYTLFVLFLTPLFVLVADLVAPGHGGGIALARAANNMLGSVLAFAGCVLLWPERAAASLRDQLAEAVEANLRFAALAVDAEAPNETAEAARREAGVRTTAAEEAVHRLALAGRGRRARLADAEALLAAARRVASYATARRLMGGAATPSEGGPRGTRYAALAIALPAFIRSRDQAAFNGLAFDHPSTGLDASVVELAEACQRYAH
jgi:uncharacterized membrane protein YgaE (UPF0421/DUF939 family)